MQLFVSVAIVFFPRLPEKMMADESLLWTSPAGMGAKKIEYHDFFFMGGSVNPSSGIPMWNRIRLGAPFAAVTIDKMVGSPRWMARIEIQFIILNLIAAIGIFGIFKKLKWSRDAEPEAR
jgi:hypothetical protein